MEPPQNHNPNSPCWNLPPRNHCRVCHHAWFEQPLLKFENMPRIAQFLPDESSLESDKGVDVELYQCSGCGLVQLNNDPVPYYRDVIRAASVSEEMKEFRKKQFAAFVERFSLEAKKVIEIGCGRGEYLSILVQHAQESYGLEHLHESVTQCLTSGLRVSEGFIQNGEDILEHAPFDGFLMLNFLEHLPDPNAILRGIHHNLTEGGVGLVEVPSFDMIVRKKLFSEFTTDHLLYFTAHTLGAVLNLNGFDMVECREEWHEYVLSATVRKRKKIDLSHFHHHQQQIRSDIERFLHRFEHKKVAVWGAGHQALAAISMMDLTGRIRYVVDSAHFKQGRFTPATHLPIVSPGALDSDPVDAVIVMAASYSDEVAEIIRQKHGVRMEISILRDFGLEPV